MTRIRRRLERDFGHIADRASPSPDAWTSIRTRIEQQGDSSEMEVVMIEAEEPPTRTSPKRLLPVAAAVLVLVVIAAVVFTTSSDDDQVDVTDEESGIPIPDDVSAVIAVGGETHRLTELDTCFVDPDAHDVGPPLLHVTGDGEDGTTAELSFYYGVANETGSSAEQYNGRVTVRNGADHAVYVTHSSEPWPTLSLEPLVATGEFVMEDAAGDDTEIAFAVRCE
jgi:hypothetical protein